MGSLRRRRALRLVAVPGAVALVVVALGTSVPATATREAVEAVPAVAAASTPPVPTPPPATSGLADQSLRSSVDRLRRAQAGSSGRTPAAALVVDVELSAGASVASVRAAIAALGGTVTGRVGDILVEARIPFTRIEDLQSIRGVRYVHAPGSTAPAEAPSAAVPAVATVAPTASTLTGQEVAITGARAWHQAGFTGRTVKVGIIDQFSRRAWVAAQAHGEVPRPAGTFCRYRGQACDLFARILVHGLAVAEVVHDMAPGATLYLASASSAADMEAAVDYFARSGVKVISHSETAEFDGDGAGSGARAAVVARAAALGMAWFQSAGNNHPGGGFQGGYYRSLWHPGTGAGAAFFNFGTDAAPKYSLRASCTFFNGLRWNDFASANPTDYAVDVYRPGQVNQSGLLATYDSRQAGGAAPPIEVMQEPPCPTPAADGLSHVDLVIRLVSVGDGASNDTLELGSNGQLDGPKPTEYFGASGPFSDSSSSGMLSVGAIGDNPFGASLAPYSSLGPTNDGRVKPDISAPTCLTTYAYSHAPGQAPRCFAGTSAAAPVVAGTAALVLQARLAPTPAKLKAYLLSHALDMGFYGPDIGFGAGEVHLPRPPGDRIKPRVIATPGQRFQRGRTAKVLYSVYDNSNVTRDSIRVTRGRSVLLSASSGFAADTGHRFYFSWKIPRALAAGSARLCVTATDRARNTAVSCTPVRITR